MYEMDKRFNSLMKKINKTDINKFMEAEKLNATYFSSALDIDLYIDSTGIPEKIQFKQNIDQKVQDEIAESFSKIKYFPAEDKGKKVKSILSIKLGAGMYEFKGTKMPVWSYQEMPLQKDLSEKFVKGIDKNSYMQNTATMPEPVGGINTLMENLYYPEEAKRNNVEGKVYIQAYIDEEGAVDGVSVIKGIGNGCDEAAMEAVLASKFVPGKNEKGEPVKVVISVPFMFKLYTK
jgi:TonB family protein